MSRGAALPDLPDPLGVRAACAWVVERARHVRLEPRAIHELADRLAAEGLDRPTWRVAPHWWDDADPDATAGYVVLLDALNFSFWGEPKWHVRWRGERYDGYFGLAAALRRAIEAGQPAWEPEYLVRQASASTLLEGADGTPIPLLEARQNALREVGQGLRDHCGDSFVGCLAEAGGDAAALVRLVVERFPSFRDVARYDGRDVPLYKRAQILVADVWGAFEGRGPGAFHNLDSLTMFADYKVPQVLHGLGVLAYSEDLTGTLRARAEIPPGDPREVEIRAASVHAVEQVRAALAGLGRPMPSFEIDWRLWQLGQGRQWPLPYHRTRTVAY